ncbi:MAG TPA: VWA domain-containing protein, partial [Verrucomicrobia bacterium]|nr:VWA domain-containing protein [Verrucomicrobiota bacterium]
MSFLTPLYALGILAIGLPILLHLIQQAPRKRKEFSSLMFLSPTPPKRTKRKKLDQILLLVFRCLILCLLALAFARPFLKSDNPFVKSDKIEDYYVFLVDSSASMMRGDLWNDALEELGKSLEEVQEEDRACIMHFDTRLVQVLGFDDWKEMGSIQGQQTAVERLRNVTLSWNATHLGAALINASEVLDEVLTQSGKPSPDSTLKIVVITDLQNGSRLDELQGYHWPENLLVEIHPLVPDQTTNAGLQLVGRIADSLDQDSKVQNRIRVTNSMDSEQESFQLEFQEISENGAQKLSSMDVYLLPGQSKVIQTPPMPAEEGNYMKVLLKDGGADYDNGLIVPPTESRKSLVFYIGEEDPNNPEDAYYYLQRVFQLTIDREVTVESQLVKNAPTQEMITRAQEADMIVVAGSPAKPWLPILQQYVRGGGRILFAMKNADMSRDLEK